MTAITKPTSRVTLGALDGTFGSDRNRRLVATLAPGDVLVLRPQGTRRSETVALQDVYRYAIKCRVNRALLEKARERKATKEAAAKTRALARAVKREQRVDRPTGMDRLGLNSYR